MHLSIKGFLKRKKMEKVAAMKSDAPLCLDDGERSRQTCADLPQMTLADGESADLLQCQEDSVNSSALKYRRYGYEVFSACRQGH